MSLTLPLFAADLSEAWFDRTRYAINAGHHPLEVGPDGSLRIWSHRRAEFMPLLLPNGHTCFASVDEACAVADRLGASCLETQAKTAPRGLETPANGILASDEVPDPPRNRA